MNARQAKWIVEELCPFILREQGRGFAMECWLTYVPKKSKPIFDGIARKAPSCGKVRCIDGSIHILTGGRHAVSAMGLTNVQAHDLIYGCQWPQSFLTAFAKAKTTLGKARVAVALLKLVAKTRGRCLSGDRP